MCGCPSELREAVSHVSGRQLIAGIRPEHFEDASLVGEALDRGTTFRRRSKSWSRWAPSSTPTSRLPRKRQIESQELRELAEDAGGGEVPMAGEEGRIVARLDPASQVRIGQEAELFVDATRLHLFDPDNGLNLTVEQRGPAATTAGDGAPTTASAQGGGAAPAESGAPADTSQDVTGEDPQSPPPVAGYFSSRRSLCTIVSWSPPGLSRSRRTASITASSHSWVRSSR